MMDLATFLLASALTYSVPIILAGIGCQVSLAAGDLNIGLEGMILGGAFTAVATTYFLGSPAFGVLGAVIVGAVLGAVFGWLIVILKGNVFIVGITYNLLLAALTVLLLGLVFGVRGSFSNPDLTGIGSPPLGMLRDLPIIGPALADQTWLAYFAFVVVGGAAYLLRSTPVGLRIRAMGENPEAVRTAGINVERLRLNIQIGCGVLCGLAGAQLALGSLTLFSAGMSAGRGFVALAIVLLVGQRPWFLALAAVLFGIADGIGIKLQTADIPPQLPQMLPYLITLVTLCIISARRQQRNRTEFGRPSH
jgi:simple sugar transport system permease protein